SNGVYKHTNTPSFEILLFSYAVNGGEVKTVDLASGEKVPEDVIKSLTDNNVIKWAFNANFERVCLSVWLKKYYPKYFKGYNSDEEALKNYLDPTSWRCSMIWSTCMGLPRKLEQVCKALNLSKQKMEEGKNLIQYFCHPCEKTKKNGGRERNLPQHAPEKWETFKQYNKRDVEAELEIKERLRLHPIPEDIWEQYAQDQKINDRGVKIDIDFVKQARELASVDRAERAEELKKLTNMDNPNSCSQLKNWLGAQGVKNSNVDKQAIEDLLKDPSTPPNVAKVLKLKQQLSKSSVSKYDKMFDMVCLDGRLRGCLQFYGASTTGRWAGRGVQLQNLPQNHIEELDKARNAVITSNAVAMKEAFVTTGKVNGVKTLIPLTIPDALSQLIRTALIPEKGYKFIVSDYSQIEARVLSWLAGEQWRLDAFRASKDIYCASASQMFGVPVEKNGQNADLRVKGKIAELALGYGGGEDALARMDSKKELDGANLPEIVDKWRMANPRIVELWKQCNQSAQHVIQKRSGVEIDNLHFWCPENTLYIGLPSGRSLAYRYPELKPGADGYLNITYQGVGGKGMNETKTYGAKLVENIVQGISRDILAYALQNLSNYRVVAHIHDEVIVEVPKDIPINTITGIMEQTPSWIEGLPLRAEGYECLYYQKQ
ncbi:MAG: DNA polymerase, partial [Pseudomonadota bacterium]|nr:DNA polymerase [Pseudomonadota bacterium]